MYYIIERERMHVGMLGLDVDDSSNAQSISCTCTLVP